MTSAFSAIFRQGRRLSSSAWVLGAATLPLSVETLVRGLLDPLLVFRQRDFLLAVILVAGAVLGAVILTRGKGKHLTGSLAFGLTGLIVVLSAMLEAFKSSATGLGSLAGSPKGVFAVAVSLVLTALMIIGSNRLFKCGLARVAVLLLAVAVAVSGAFMVSTPGNPTRSQPISHTDILLIVLDTTRADHLSLYGYERPTTPVLERLSKEARVYERAWSPAPWTPPAHASILTGLLPAQHNCDGGSFDPPSPSLAEILQDAGYATLASINNPILVGEGGWARGFDDYRRTAARPGFSLAFIDWVLHVRDGDWKFTGDTETSLQWVRRWWSRHRSTPRFVLINLIDPHSPYGPEGKASGVFLDERTAAARPLPNDSEEYDAGLVQAQGASLDQTIAWYDADILQMDRALGDFFEWLGPHELDQTLVVITADHGERLGERGLLGHQLGLDEVLLRVPLIVRYPPKVPAGRATDPVQTHGIFATILEHVGVHPPAASLDHAPALDQQDASAMVAQARYQEWYLNLVKNRNPSFDASPHAGDWGSVTEGPWKLVGSSTGIRRLYRLDEDAAEERDLSAQNPDVLSRLSPLLENLPKFESPPQKLEVPEDTLRLLRGLGYAE